MAALVVINAMVFQDRLASNEAAFQPVSAAVMQGQFSRNTLLQVWDYILGIDYYPIFSMARDVVKELTEVEAAGVLDECAKTAATLLGMGAVGRHDLAGRIFNRLIAERKLLAAFYTSIPASSLLAGLALSPGRWPKVDWSNAEGISHLRVVDPACGTGTLLMAAYRQIVQNHCGCRFGMIPTNPLIHQALVEQVITGADVVQAAIHLTAATLAAMSPSVRFQRMQLHTLQIGHGNTKELAREGIQGRLAWLPGLAEGIGNPVPFLDNRRAGRSDHRRREASCSGRWQTWSSATLHLPGGAATEEKRGPFQECSPCRRAIRRSQAGHN